MTDKYQELLIEWCDALVRAQITDKGEEHFGGFRCESCSFPHGRADNAIYPLVYAHILTGEEKYLAAAERLLFFRRELAEADGAMKNDFTSPWKGITAFSAIGLLKTLLSFGDKLPSDFRTEIEECAIASARWVHENMTIGFPAYVNYYCAASLVNALYDELYHDDAYRARAKELLDYCLSLFTENGLLAGEGKPHDDRSPKGCLPIDVGYIAEESLPCLLHAAELLGDEEAMRALTAHAVKLLDFLLPDGGWDNSFGVRNNKWTYYGSRTSDGCIGAFAALAARDDRFAEAAERTYEILRACTADGLLYGGPQYRANGQKPCVHHTFCHAAALTDAILAGLKEPKRRPLPSNEEGIGFKYYPEIDTYRVRAGRYLATLTAYDYATHHFAHGAAHASGGTLSLLYKRGAGVMIAGSVYEYKLTEPNNMQTPTGERKHATLIPRAEYEKDGVKYATCLDREAAISLREEEGTVTATVRAAFRSAENVIADKDAFAEFRYRFAPEGITIRIRSTIPATFVLPLVAGSGTLSTDAPFDKERTFFLTGGFAAEEYAFPLREEVTITLK